VVLDGDVLEGCCEVVSVLEELDDGVLVLVPEDEVLLDPEVVLDGLVVLC